MKTLEIYGTLGPSCKDKDTILKMMEAGMNGMRLNLSHCNLWDKEDWIENFHLAKKEANIEANLLIDMKGPELRVGTSNKDMHLLEDTTITFTSPFIPKEIMQNACIKDILLIDDGKIRLEVEKNNGTFLWCKTLTGGTLKDRKSIAIEGKSITGNVLSENDIANLKEAKKYGVTGIMQPFVRSAQDLMKVKEVLESVHAQNLKIYAKIENKEGFEALPTLFPYCDMIIIARGDLGNAYGLAKLPVIQHKIETLCKENKMPYMVVTQMLDSMSENKVPTRAEVSDIFHAVYHGASSIMLTGETANGKYPIEAMTYFTQCAKEALHYKGEKQ